MCWVRLSSVTTLSGQTSCISSCFSITRSPDATSTLSRSDAFGVSATTSSPRRSSRLRPSRKTVQSRNPWASSLGPVNLCLQKFHDNLSRNLSLVQDFPATAPGHCPATEKHRACSGSPAILRRNSLRNASGYQRLRESRGKHHMGACPQGFRRSSKRLRHVNLRTSVGILTAVVLVGACHGRGPAPMTPTGCQTVEKGISLLRVGHGCQRDLSDVDSCWSAEP
jgi:hypothetical protein